MPKNLYKDERIVIPIYGGRMKWMDIKVCLGGVEVKKNKGVVLVEQGDETAKWIHEQVNLIKFKNK